MKVIFKSKILILAKEITVFLHDICVAVIAMMASSMTKDSVNRTMNNG
jgi:hypothetical protein